MNTNWTSATPDWPWRTSEPVFAATEVHSDFKWTVRRGLGRRTLALARSYLEDNLGDNVTLGDLGKAVGVSRAVRPCREDFRIADGRASGLVWRATWVLPLPS